MSERDEIIQQTRQYEVIHKDRSLETYVGSKKIHRNGFDFIVTPEVASMTQIEALFATLASVILDITDSEIDACNYRYFDTSTDLGEVFMKRKGSPGLDSTKRFRERIARMAMKLDLSPEIILEASMQWRTNASVLCEMNLAEDIETITSTSPAQEMAAKYGFESIEFIRPLLAVVDKEIGFKYMVFRDYGILKRCEARTKIAEGSLADELAVLFAKNGILVSDLTERQLICADETSTKLYLVDAEEYRPAKPGQLDRMWGLWPPLN